MWSRHSCLPSVESGDAAFSTDMPAREHRRILSGYLTWSGSIDLIVAASHALYDRPPFEPPIEWCRQEPCRPIVGESPGQSSAGKGPCMLPRHCVMSVILAVGLLSKAHGGENLEARVEAVLQTPGYQNAHWGLLVVDLATGKKIYERNADQMFCPASVTKLFTTSAALDDLGSEYRFHTPVVRRGDVDPDGTLKGDLILIAQGDLCFGGRAGPNGSLLFKDNDHSYAAGNLEAAIVPADPLAGLDQLARQVSEAGIKAVDGDVLIDDRLFEKASSSGSGPARVTPILINDNVVDVVITPGARPGEPAAVKTVPVTSFVTCDAQVETVPAGERTSLEVIAQGAQQFSVRGRVPVGHKPVVKIFAV